MKAPSSEGKRLLESLRASESMTESGKADAWARIEERLAAGDVPDVDVDPPDVSASAAAPGTSLAVKILAVSVVAAIPALLYATRQPEPSPSPRPAVVTATPSVAPSAAPPAPAPSAIPFSELPRAQPSSVPRVVPPRPSAAVSAASSASAEAPSPEEKDDAEVRLLTEAHRALTGGDSARALGLLAEHERRFPGSALAATRTVTRAMAWCAQGDARGRAAATSFLHMNPNSPFAARLRASCGLP